MMSFYQTVKDAFAIVAMAGPALYSNIVLPMVPKESERDRDWW